MWKWCHQTRLWPYRVGLASFLNIGIVWKNNVTCKAKTQHGQIDTGESETFGLPDGPDDADVEDASGDDVDA